MNSATMDAPRKQSRLESILQHAEEIRENLSAAAGRLDKRLSAIGAPNPEVLDHPHGVVGGTIGKEMPLVERIDQALNDIHRIEERLRGLVDRTELL